MSDFEMEIEHMRSRKDPVEILRRFLENPAHPETAHELVAEDAIHLSINDQRPPTLVGSASRDDGRPAKRPASPMRARSCKNICGIRRIV
ncbi:hypothetical protein ACC719_11465 [Rhizobium ruizarguesonis]